MRNQVPNLSIIVAVQQADANLPEIIQHLRPDRHSDVEFLFCHTDADSMTPDRLPDLENVNVVRSVAGSPIPVLWRDGIVAAKAEIVAVTTAHCIPADDWVDHLKKADLTETVGIGGVIENHGASDGKGWAIFMLRYLPFSPPQTARITGDIAADNAVYCRAEILRHGDLLSDGFWEPSFHARFSADGLVLRIDPGLRTYHRNRYGAKEFATQRLVHGRAFGLARVRDADAQQRWFRLATVPLLPAVFFLKILSRVFRHKNTLAHLPVALPWLIFFVLAWIAGEAAGYLDGIKPPKSQPKGALSS